MLISRGILVSFASWLDAELLLLFSFVTSRDEFDLLTIPKQPTALGRGSFTALRLRLRYAPSSARVASIYDRIRFVAD